jgi:hypothetical protein
VFLFHKALPFIVSVQEFFILFGFTFCEGIFAATVELLIEVIFEAHLARYILAFILLEVAIKILGFWILELQFGTDSIQDLGVLLAADGHHCGKPIVAILFGIGKGLIHPFGITEDATGEPFGLVGVRLKIFVVIIVIVGTFHHFDGTMIFLVEKNDKTFKFFEPAVMLFLGVNIRIVEEDGHIKIITEEFHGKSSTGATTRMKQKTGALALDFGEFF